MHEYIVIRTIVRLLFPFIFMYGLYVQLHGEYSPGGGFQAGVMCASAFVVYGLVYGLKHVQETLPLPVLRALCSLGVLVYGGLGVVTMMRGGRFLDYSVLHKTASVGQQIGITVIELGVGVTVFSMVMITFYAFGERA